MTASALSRSVMLATSMHAQPGVYAVLLGSGVSTGAGIPTGWGVVQELVRRTAAIATPDDPDSLRLAHEDPGRWWVEHGEGDLGYSSLLQALAPTPAARQGLLAPFFEPTDEERDRGLKVPSRAHLALAKLVKQGFVRVIITTNFDRLTEQSLDAEGIAPQVITRPEAVNGMAPLAHANATVIKLHGDYLDLGTRNTVEELAMYPEEWATLLRQVFDEYGLLVSGWSAEWDTALVAALEATSNRRYPLYWDQRSSKSDTAQRVLANRAGQVIPGAGADELFTDLLESVEALTRLAQPPLTTAMAVARLKRYLPDPRRNIDLHDLVMGAADDLAAHIDEQPLSVPAIDGAALQRIYEDHLEASNPLIELLVTGIWHTPPGQHERLWADALQRVIDAGTSPIQGATDLLDLARRWPALFIIFATGIACVRRGHEGLLIRLATEPNGRPQLGIGDRLPVAQLLHPQSLLQKDWVNTFPRWGAEHTGWIYAASHILKTDLRRHFNDRIPLDDDYEAAFHGYEFRLGLIQEHITDGKPWRALSGEYVSQWQWSRTNPTMPLAEIEFRSVAGRAKDWPWDQCLEDFDQALIRHREVLGRYRRW